MDLTLIIQNPWIRLFLLLFSLFVFLKIGLLIIFYFLKKIVLMTKTKRDDKLLDDLESPLAILITLIALKFGSEFLVSLNIPSQMLIHILDTLVIFFLAKVIIIISSLIFEVFVSSSKKINLNVQLISIFEKIFTALIYIFAFIIILDRWGINIWPILGSLGVVGLALAFALQETLKNLIGGIQLILDKNFKKGDIVELSAGPSGVIYDITLRSTRIQTWDDKLIIIPNMIMANDMITNISKPDKARRITVKFGVEYGTDPEYVKEIILQEIKKIKHVETKDPEPIVYFKEMGDSALLFEAKYWVMDYANYLSAKESGTIKIYDRLNNEGIGIPFPQITVWNNDMGKPFTKKYKKKTIKK